MAAPGVLKAFLGLFGKFWSILETLVKIGGGGGPSFLDPPLNNIGIQMKRKVLIRTFVIISN